MIDKLKAELLESRRNLEKILLGCLWRAKLMQHQKIANECSK